MNNGIIMPLLPAHQREAESLYRHRLTLLEKVSVPLTVLHGLDLRLAGNLFALSLPDEQGCVHLPQRSPAATFVHLWVMLYRDPEATLAALASAFEQLEPDHRDASLHALHWRSSAGLARLIDIARTNGTLTPWPPALEAALLFSSDTPASITARLHQDTPAPLCIRLLQYLDEQPDSPCDVFRPWYQHPDADVRDSALIAGLHRRDPDALDVLEHSVPAATTAEPHGLQRISWLLASRQRPALIPAHPLIAGLSGSAAAASALLDWLAHPASAESAAQGWFWLTGQTLPRRPRLQEVGGDTPANAPTLPDADAAHGWWAQHGWPDGQSQPPGGPATAPHVPLAGQIMTLRAALAGLSQGHAHSILYRPATLWFTALSEDA
ncbi:MAG: hypothetical protein LAT61_05575 [Alcanivorax sp.]|nr:hypothetical protein [Alcanivorax sp.]